MFHNLLNRQLKRVFGQSIPQDEEFLRFISMVNESYIHNDNDRLLLERSMELSSDELSFANKQLRLETENQREILTKLLDSISVLTSDDAELKEFKSSIEPKNSDDIIVILDRLNELAIVKQQNEALLLLQEARMAEAQKLANFGTWMYTFKTKKTEWSNHLSEIFEQNDLHHLNDIKYLELVYSEDRSLVEKELKNLFQKQLTTITHRVIKKNGEVRWIDASFKLILDDQNNPYQLLGTALDISKLKMAESALEYKIREMEETSAFLDTVIEEMPLSVYVKDAQTRQYIKFNRIGIGMIKLKDYDVVGKTNSEIFDEFHAKMYNDQDDQVIASRSILTIEEEPYKSEDGLNLFFRVQKVPVFDQENNIKYILTISEDVTERRKVEEQIRLAAKTADEANKAKSSFLSSMSHELRTPLNAIIGFSQILQRDQSIPAQQRSYVETMYRSGNHLLAMINDVLDISKIESGKFDLAFEPFSLFDIAHDIESMFSLRAKEKGIQLGIHLAHSLPPVLFSDSKRIQQVLINLVGNALKFTAKGSIDLTITAEPIPETSSYSVTFLVEDSGRGIPENQIKHIFEPFRQVKGFHSEGTGLGLAISSKITEMLNGSLNVISRLGKGSEFRFNLPIEAAYDENYYSDEVYKPVTGIVGEKRWKVLIIDDIQNNRAVVRAFLESIGFDCIEADNGYDGVIMSELFKPDIIFLDIMMPGLNGEETFKKIKANPDLQFIKIIALTASGSLNRKEELLALGFDDYITKPYREKWLIQSLERVAGIEFTVDLIDHNQEKTEYSDLKIDLCIKWLISQSNDFKKEFIETSELQDFTHLANLVFPHINSSEMALYIFNKSKMKDHIFFINLAERISLL